MIGEPPSYLERMVRRDRLVMGVGLAALVLLAWIDLIRMAGAMRAAAGEAAMHAAMGMADGHAWGVGDFSGLASMWAVMMLAMMLPSAAPVMLLIVGVYRRRGGRDASLAMPVFAAGYLAAWTAFSLAAAGAQVLLHRAALLSPAMAGGSRPFMAAVLVVAGLYQWLPVKAACLAHCRSPLDFLTRHWREGVGGAFGMGLRHGWFCVGCCWALMALLFVVGVMNLAWVAALAAFVLVEKMARRGPFVGRIGGALLILWALGLAIYK